jgi:hypothetical protein
MALSYDAQIALALAEIGSENKLNYAKYAKKVRIGPEYAVAAP